MELILRANAKINLNLCILGLREDGFHEIDTVMQSISLSDELTISERPRGISVETLGKELPAARKNLAYRAAELFLAQVRERAGIKIVIEKSIPIGAGLGGGSADAAAVLVGLNELYDHKLKEEELIALAAEIGSDVPFFIRGGRARCRGRGEIIEPLPEETKKWYVLVKPNFSVSSKKAYAEYDRVEKSPMSEVQSRKPTFAKASAGELLVVSRQSVNDLEAVVARMHPLILEIKRELCERGAKSAIMSGSGSVVWGEVGSRAEGERLISVLSLRDGEMFITHSVSQGIEIKR